jgi:NAD(P)-dependent dehydrogenase (short-subunit alcohol dehydrogenase family)
LRVLRRVDETVNTCRVGAATDMTGKAGVVTGAGSGIGRACATALAEAGATVVVSDLDVDAAAGTAELIGAAGGTAIANRCDVTNAGEVAAMVAQSVDRYGALDFAVNNAGVVGVQQPLHKIAIDDWNRIIAVNLTSVFVCMGEQLRQMYRQGSGSIVNIASEASLKGSAADAAYTASKAGVAGMTKTAALEATRRGVRVNAVCPGVIETAILANLRESDPERYALAQRLMPIGRYGQPGEIAAAVLWLCSDASSLMVGHLLAVDGGWAVA